VVSVVESIARLMLPYILQVKKEDPNALREARHP
jgi:hypothetical protein